MRQHRYGLALGVCKAGAQRAEQLIELISQLIDGGLAIAQCAKLRFRSFPSQQIADAPDCLKRGWRRSCRLSQARRIRTPKVDLRRFGHRPRCDFAVLPFVPYRRKARRWLCRA